MPTAPYRIAARHPLAGELALVLAIKIGLLALAGVFLFGADQRVHVDTSIAAHRMFDRDVSPTSE